MKELYPYRYSLVLLVLFVGLASFAVWASLFNVDQVARAVGEVIASSRVQVIQSVDGGVLSELPVKEGDRVQKNQVIARLDQTRVGAAVREIEARLSALKAKAVRLRAEVTQAQKLVFPDAVLKFPEQAKLETALFNQRRQGFSAEQETLRVAVRLAQEELKLLQRLAKTGDANQSEIIRAKKAVNEAKAKRVNSKNKYFEDASNALAKTEDEIAQNEQVLTQRKQQLADSVFRAHLPGIVKNIRISTVGGVLRPGEELMQIVPVDDELIIEAKINPSDISMVRPHQPANIRFDPFDYTIYGSVEGEVVYVSADTLKEDTRQGEETYYRVHIVTKSNPAITTAGKQLEILPGMTAQVDIRSGTRTLMDYLLKPLRKTLSESFGER